MAAHCRSPRVQEFRCFLVRALRDFRYARLRVVSVVPRTSCREPVVEFVYSDLCGEHFLQETCEQLGIRELEAGEAVMWLENVVV